SVLPAGASRQHLPPPAFYRHESGDPDTDDRSAQRQLGIAVGFAVGGLHLRLGGALLFREESARHVQASVLQFARRFCDVPGHADR
nr:hypothetical protein [Tanacetum cinerariifolium]